MYALDFEYDGQCLSDYGFIICDFDHKTGANVISAGSKIILNTVSKNKGKNRSVTSVQYDECVQVMFDICKNPDVYDTDLKITDEEFRELIRWLNRKKFFPFRFLHDGFFECDECFYDATFNIEKIEINSALCGLRLTMETDKPYAYGIEQVVSLSQGENSVHVHSDETGYIYPDMKITCNASGNLEIQNKTYGSNMVIKNCTEGEVITIMGDSRIILSSVPSHAVYNDFNFDFLYIGNDYNDNINSISVNMPATIEMKYTPIIKNAPY